MNNLTVIIDKKEKIMSNPPASPEQTPAQKEATNLMQQYVKSCWCPEVSVAQGNLDILTSKYFGNPWLAEDEAWPMIKDEPAIFILQLEIKTLPEQISKLLGGEGYLQFFYTSIAEYDPGYDQLIRIVRPDGQGARLSQPEVEYSEDRTQRIITSWTEHADLPRSEDYDDTIEEALDEIAEKYDVDSDDLTQEAYQGDKLAGWPFWTQGNETPTDSQGDEMMLVYQLDAGCFFDGQKFPAYAPCLFAGDGTGHIFVSKNNPNELYFCWACG